MRTARDTELTGFRCIVNRNSKRLVYQGELREGGKRHTVYKRLGDPTHVKVGEARARALEELARLERMTDPDARAGTTFREAWESYKARLEKKKRSDRTIADYRQKFDAQLAPTFARVALRDITRADVVRLHDRLTAEVGPYAANGVCRVGQSFGGQIDSIFGDVVILKPHVEAASIRALAVTSSRRSALLPQVPTMAEANLPEVRTEVWHGLLAPARTPAPVLDMLKAAVQDTQNDPTYKENLCKYGIELNGVGSEAFAEFIKADSDRWTPIIKGIGLTFQ